MDSDEDTTMRDAKIGESSGSGWNDVAGFYQHAQANKPLRGKSKAKERSDFVKLKGSDPLVLPLDEDVSFGVPTREENTEIRNEIRAVVCDTDSRRQKRYIWQCHICAKKRVKVVYETCRFLSARLHAVYHYSVIHRKDRNRLLASKERISLERELGIPVSINFQMEDELRGQKKSDEELISLCLNDNCVASVLRVHFSEGKNEPLYICFCYQFFGTVSCLRRHCEDAHGLIASVPQENKNDSGHFQCVAVKSENEPISCFTIIEQREQRPSCSLSMDQTRTLQATPKKIINWKARSASTTPASSECEISDSESSYSPLDSDDDLFERDVGPESRRSSSSSLDESEKRPTGGYVYRRHNPCCNYCSIQVGGSCEAVACLQLLYHYFHRHKNNAQATKEASEKRLILEQKLNTKLSFTDNSKALESAISGMGSNIAADVVLEHCVSDADLVERLRRESECQNYMWVCFCYKVFRRDEKLLIHLRKTHGISGLQGKKITRELPSQEPRYANAFVRFREEMAFTEGAVSWPCIVCKKRVRPVESHPLSAGHELFLHMLAIHHVLTEHSDKKDAVEIAERGRALWEERIGTPLEIHREVPGYLKEATSLEHWMELFADQNPNLLRNLSKMVGVQLNDQKNDVALCFCYRLFRWQYLYSHLRNDHSFCLWSCRISPHTSKSFSQRFYWLCCFCKAKLSCNHGELALRLLSYAHVARQHTSERLAPAYCRKEKLYLESELKSSLKLIDFPKFDSALSIKDARKLSVQNKDFIAAMNYSAYGSSSGPLVVCRCYSTLYDEHQFRCHLRRVHNIPVKCKK